MPPLNPSVADGQIESQRNRGRRSVAMLSHRGDHLLDRHAEAFAGGLDDADVGLMGNQPVNIADADTGLSHHLAGHVDEHLDRKLEDRLAVHSQEGVTDHLAAIDLARHRQMGL